MYKKIMIIYFFIHIFLVSVNSQSLNSSRACIIGAGYSGLAAARYMKQYQVNFTVFEATRDYGGTWRFDPHIGTDEDGIPVFSSMYKNYITNTPRQTMEYFDFPFPEGTPSYLSATCFHNYLKSFVKHFNLLENIQLRSLVTAVKRVADHWELTYMKTHTKEIVTETCDFITVANGPYNVPVWPKIDGVEKYRGNMIHSHHYKEAMPFKNRKVLIIGAGPSSLDIAMQLSRVAAKLVHSHHLIYNQPKFPGVYVRKPDVLSFTSKGAIFKDASYEDLDDVILCTGYGYNHPFLDTKSGVISNVRYVLPLYQHMVNIRNPSMVFIGVAKKIMNRVMDAQAEYAAILASGKLKLPSRGEMFHAWSNHLFSLTEGKQFDELNIISDMDQYFGNLTEQAGVTKAPSVLTMISKSNAGTRLNTLLNYRKYDYRIINDHQFEKHYDSRPNLSCPVEL